MYISDKIIKDKNIQGSLIEKIEVNWTEVACTTDNLIHHLNIAVPHTSLAQAERTCNKFLDESMTANFQVK